MRKSLSDKGVAALKPRAARYAVSDPELRGHYVRVQSNGAKSFVTVTRAPNGKQIWTTLGATDVIDISAARDLARGILQRIRSGLPAVEPKAESFDMVAAAWLKRHVEKNGLRTAHEIERLLNRHVLPVWRDRELTSLRRTDVTALLDTIEDGGSPHQADAVLTVIRSLMNWYATRNDGYIPPIVRGMRRQSPHAQQRSRILADDELRAIWLAAENAGAFGGVVRVCVLTAQRRTKVLSMKWDDIGDDGVWTIPREAREKDTAGAIALPEAAIAIVRAQPRFAGNPYVFAGRSNGPINGMSKFKARLDAQAGVTGWRLHDLRRTARSLMSRAGVSSEHAERVLGHALAGVEGIYDRHSYADEKAAALAKLAALIDSLVNPRENVVPLKEKRAHDKAARNNT